MSNTKRCGRALIVVISFFLSGTIFSGCTKSNKSIIRMQHLEEGVNSPTTEAELRDAIKKYQERVNDIQLADTQVGVWYKLLGIRLLDAKLYGEALKAFQSAIEYYPANQNLYYYIGVCAGYMAESSLDYNATGSSVQKNNYLKLAESAYLRAISLEPRYARALYGIGVLYVFEMDECDKAIPYLESLLTIETKNTDGMFILARAYYVTASYDKAVALYDKIISLTKSSEVKNKAAENKKMVLDAAYGK